MFKVLTSMFSIIMASVCFKVAQNNSWMASVALSLASH